MINGLNPNEQKRQLVMWYRMTSLFQHPVLSIGVIGVGITHHHVAEHSAVVDGDTYAEGITIWGNHRLEVTGRLHPVSHSFFCNSAHSCSNHHGEVGAKPMGIAAGYDGQTFFFVFMGCIQHGGAFLRRIHEGLVDRQFSDAIFSADFVDTLDHLLPDLFNGWQFI